MVLRYGLIAILAAASLALAVAPSAAPRAGAPTDGTCGGFAGVRCASDQDYCMTKTGQCRVADAQGVCKTKFQICPKIFLPVCGCDGATYSNACVANAAGVSVMYKGKCKTRHGAKA